MSISTCGIDLRDRPPGAEQRLPVRHQQHRRRSSKSWARGRIRQRRGRGARVPRLPRAPGGLHPGRRRADRSRSSPCRDWISARRPTRADPCDVVFDRFRRLQAPASVAEAWTSSCRCSTAGRGRTTISAIRAASAKMIRSASCRPSPDFSGSWPTSTAATSSYDPFDNILLAIDTLDIYLESLRTRSPATSSASPAVRRRPDGRRPLHRGVPQHACTHAEERDRERRSIRTPEDDQAAAGRRAWPATLSRRRA